MVEDWVPIPGYVGFYEVSSLGRVRSLTRCVGGRYGNEMRKGQIMVARPNHEGYPLVGLRKDGKKRSFAVHVLVLRAFIGECPPGLEARHLNGLRSDARLSNLEWNTKQVNMSDREAHGGTLRGEKSPKARLASQQVKDIRASKLSQRQLAAVHGVSKFAIYSVKAGRTWKQP